MTGAVPPKIGCWPLTARISAQGGLVVWDRFEQPHDRDRDYTGVGPYLFDVVQCTQALRAPRGHRSS